jgi:hypothetical protein
LLVAAEDLNDDGHFDLIFAKTAAADSQFNTRTRVRVHYGLPGVGGAPIEFRPEPDHVYVSAGFSMPLVLDMDGDGRHDLVLVNVEIGFWTVIRALITRSVDAEAAIYRMPPEGRYPRDPSTLQKYSVTFSLGRFAHQPISQFGDLNGDGLPDLLLSRDKETLGIHWGRREAVWPGSPDVRLQDLMPIQGRRVQVTDLDGDGRDDLLFLYNRDDIRQMPEVNRSVTVLHSRAGTPRGADATPRAAQR